MEVPTNLDSRTATAIRVAVQHAFIFGFRVIMLICAGLGAASSAVAWLFR
jgi:hypothetical protein